MKWGIGYNPRKKQRLVQTPINSRRDIGNDSSTEFNELKACAACVACIEAPCNRFALPPELIQARCAWKQGAWQRTRDVH